MKPRDDKPGIILDQFREVDILSMGMQIIEERMPDELAEAARRILPLEQGLTDLYNQVSELFGEDQSVIDYANPETQITVKLNESQTTIARVALKVVMQLGEDELDRQEAEDMGVELEVHLVNSHVLSCYYPN